MPSAEKLYEKWKKNCPTEVDIADFEKVITHYLGRWLRPKKGKTSHHFIVDHPALSIHPAFCGKDTLCVSVVSGRKVKGIWVRHTLEAIKSIDLWEGLAQEKENRQR